MTTPQRIRQLLNKRKPGMIGHQNLFKAAVLVPLIEQDEQWCVLFEERSAHLKRQPGEISFPGGRIEPEDESELDAALRETCEELGLAPEYVEPVGALDYIVTPFQIIHPFVGRITDFGRIRPNPDEVAGVFCVPIAYLRSVKPELHHVDMRIVPPEDFPFDRIPNGRQYNWRTGKIPEYFYHYEGRVIWGLTARILHHFLELSSE